MRTKSQDSEKDRGDSTLRNAGVENTAEPGDTARTAQAENEKLQRNPPPLAHVDPSTGKVLSQPLDTSKEANQYTVAGDGGVKDARPNNGDTR